MGNNAKQFATEIDDAIKEQWLKRFLELHKTISLKCYKYIQTDSRSVDIEYGSPVMTGRYSASHTLAINNTDTSTVPPGRSKGLTPLSPASSRTINAKPLSSVSLILTKLKLYDNVVIANSLPYSRKIEMGHSKLKAPNGVYNVTALVIEQLYRNVKI